MLKRIFSIEQAALVLMYYAKDQVRNSRMSTILSLDVLISFLNYQDFRFNCDMMAQLPIKIYKSVSLKKSP